MWNHHFNLLIIASLFLSLSQGLPGRRAAFNLYECRAKDNDNLGSPCSKTLSSVTGVDATSSDHGQSLVTAVPSYLLQHFRPKMDIITATCNDGECSIFDYTYSLVTVVTLSRNTSTSKFPMNITSTPASGTGIVSATGLSTTRSREVNGTTVITSRVTKSVTTVVIPDWINWPSVEGKTGAAPVASTGRPSNSFNATRPAPTSTGLLWLNWSKSAGGTGRGWLTANNATYTSRNQTLTRSVSSTRSHMCPPDNQPCTTHSDSRSYTATSTYTFSGTTVIIPIPSGYNTTTSTKSSRRSSTKTTSRRSTNVGASQTSVSTSSCWTTVDQPAFGVSTQTVTASSKICWMLVCDKNHSCSDRITRYPITVDADSTSSSTRSTSTTLTSKVPGPMSATNTSWSPWLSSGNSSSFVSSVNSTTMTLTMQSETDVNALVTSLSTSSWTSDDTIFTTIFTVLTPKASQRSTSLSHTANAASSTSEYESTYEPWLGWSPSSSSIIDSSTMSMSNGISPSATVKGTLTRTVYPIPATSTYLDSDKPY